MFEVIEYKEKKSSIRSKIEGKKWSMQFLPESLKPLTEESTFTFRDKKLKVAYLIDIIHSLILKYYFKKDNQFNLSALILKEKYGFLYNYYMDYLLESGHLALICNYLKGKNTKIYRLSDSIIQGNISRYKNDDKILLKKYKSAVSLVDDVDIETNRINPDVKKKLVSDLFQVAIEFDRAIFYLDSTLQEQDIYNKNKYSVECINDKQIFYHFDNYGRMHTNFTILKSFIRKNCLRISGDETFELDIKNSQPLFLTKIIESDGLKIVDSDELALYKYLTANGLFYQYIMDNSEIRDKKSCKEMIYKVFFGKNFKNKSDTLFESLFPTIYNFIKIYKKKKGDYRILSHQLQNLESELIFNKIVKEIMYIYPEVTLVTVHDSLIFSQRYREWVEKIFYQNLKKEFNI
jgi:hypothetical protein